GPDRSVQLSFGRPRNRVDHGLGRRVDHVDVRTALAAGPVRADEQPLAGHDGTRVVPVVPGAGAGAAKARCNVGTLPAFQLLCGGPAGKTTTWPASTSARTPSSSPAIVPSIT